MLLQLGVIGLSHAAAPRAWCDFFAWLRSKGEAGVFAIAFLTLWFGTIIVAFHAVWTGWAAVITVLGWGQVFKGALYFIFPRIGLKMLRRVEADSAHLFRWGGLAMIALTAVLAWQLFAR